MQVGGIDHYVLSKSAFAPWIVRTAGRKDPPEIPVAVLVLAQVNDRIPCFEVREQNPAVEDVARIVLESDRSRSDEERIFVVAYLQRVDHDTVEESAVDAADVHFPFHAPGQHGRDHLANALLTEAGVRYTDEA